jgi:hypothetical protein
MHHEKSRNNSLVVIDVELRIWVCSTGCLESNSYVIFSNHIVEDAVTERAILVENLVHNVLGKVSDVPL